MFFRARGGLSDAFVLSLVLVVGASPACRRPEGLGAGGGQSPGASAPAADPLTQAVLKVEEDRGEDSGRKAKVEIPSQLKHYSDRRRFLAIQAAEAREQGLQIPHDFAELAGMIREGVMVELPALGENLLPYGVGQNAHDGPFTHYDGKTGRSVPLYNEEELRGEYARLDEALKTSAAEVAALREQSKGLDKRDRGGRAELAKKIAAAEKSAAKEKKTKAQLEAAYGDPKTRQVLERERAQIEELAADFGGRRYDLSDAASRKELKARMLRYVRPAALDVLEGVGRSYREKFGRHLPVTSLVRTSEYQRELGRENPNAANMEAAPHTTGLAFDIYYRFMTAEEQAHVMGDLARLRDEGRVEALRELRDHYHVFAFADGERPPEALIKKARAAREEPDADDEPREKKKAPAAKEKKSRAEPAARAKARAADKAKSSKSKPRERRRRP